MLRRALCAISLLLVLAAIAIWLDACAAAPALPPDQMLEVPTPDVLGPRTFRFENNGPETVALHVKEGVLCRVPPHQACEVRWKGYRYVAEMRP